MIRPYREEDFERVTKFWFEAMDTAMPGLEQRMGHTLDGARQYFRDVISIENQLWVYESNGRPVGYVALRDEFVDRLYVDPVYHRRGIGQALFDYAKMLSPHHLWLYTHAANTAARAFYEKNGCVAEKFGVSPAPESEPEVEYHWRPNI